MGRGGYKFGPESMFSGIKSDFPRILVDSRGKILNPDDLFPSGEENFVTSYF